jgi:CubicO group peptidase (beta-lactamase class C family)
MTPETRRTNSTTRPKKGATKGSPANSAGNGSGERPIDAVADRLLTATRAFVQDARLPGAAAGVVTRDGLVWSTGSGFADLDSARRPDADTLFRVASITKLFTAVAILQLRDRGLLRLDDPLVAHLPEFAEVSSPFGPIEDVTIRRLLTHESGLQGEHPYDDPAVFAWPSAEEAVATLHRVRVAIPPSTQHKYSNLGYNLLGEVVARSGNGSWEDTVRERILAPLGMDATTCEPGGKLLGRCAVGYRARDCDDRVRPAEPAAPGLMPGAGMLWSTVSDLARFTAFALTADARGEAEGAVLSPRTLAEMQDCRIVTSGVPAGLQGLGFYAETGPDSASWLGHGGAWEGFITRLVFSPADAVGAIVLLNGIGEPDKLAMELASIAAEALRARRAEPAAPPAGAPPATEKLLGEYEEDGFAERVRVEWRDTTLTLIVSKAESYLMEPTDDPLVWLVRGGRWAGEPARFLLDESGEVMGANFAGNPLWRVRVVSAPSQTTGTGTRPDEPGPARSVAAGGVD